jgi:hypothetical protein
MSDAWDYIDQITEDALEEEAYYREKDREAEEAQKRDAFPLASGACSRCGKDAYLPGSMGGCFCV